MRVLMFQLAAFSLLFDKPSDAGGGPVTSPARRRGAPRLGDQTVDDLNAPPPVQDPPPVAVAEPPAAAEVTRLSIAKAALETAQAEHDDAQAEHDAAEAAKHKAKPFDPNKPAILLESGAELDAPSLLDEPVSLRGRIRLVTVGGTHYQHVSDVTEVNGAATYVRWVYRLDR